MKEAKKTIDYNLLWDPDWLRDQTQNDSSGVRLWALKKLQDFAPEAGVQAARELLTDPDPAVRNTAVKLIGNQGTADDQTLLKGHLGEASQINKGLIFQSLGKLGDSELIERGEEFLHASPPPPKNDISNFIDGLTHLKTPNATEFLWTILERTQTESTFSTVLPHLLNAASAEDYQNIMRRTLEKISSDVMINVRRFRLQLQNALGIEPARSIVQDIKEQEELTNEQLQKLVETEPYLDSLPESSQEIENALRHFNENNFVKGLTSLGKWASKQAPREQTTPQKRKSLFLLNEFQRLPASLSETKLPGNPLRELFILGIRTWLLTHRKNDLHTLLEEARQSNSHVLELYRYPGRYLLNEIVSFLSSTDIDLEQLKNDARNSMYPYRRIKAMSILSNKNHSDALPALISNFSSTLEVIRKTAVDSLCRFGEECLPVIEKKLQTQSFSTRNEFLCAADLLRKIPVQKSADLFRSSLDTFINHVGPDPIASFAVDLATPEMAEPLRAYMSDAPYIVGEQLKILSDLHNLNLPEAKQFQEKVNQASGNSTPEPHMPSALSINQQSWEFPDDNE